MAFKVLLVLCVVCHGGVLHDDVQKHLKRADLQCSVDVMDICLH